jgi:hypothetical protein
MTREQLLDGIAANIAQLLCADDYAAVPYHELNTRFKARVDRASYRVLNHITPMMQEAVEALDSVAKHGYLKDDNLWHKCKKALSSIECFVKGGV